MPINRFYIDTNFEDSVTLEGSEQRHMSTVVRALVEDTVELFNGCGELAVATITHLEKQRAHLTISEIIKKAPQNSLTLLQALPRMNRIDFIIEKCTELGASAISLFPGDFSERKMLTDHQLNRLKLLTIPACKQSGRLWLPKLHWIDPISKWTKQMDDTVFGDPTASATKLIKLIDTTQICVGPESGFSEKEKEKLFSLGAKPTVWNDAVLRTDTASISAIAIIGATRLD